MKHRQRICFLVVVLLISSSALSAQTDSLPCAGTFHTKPKIGKMLLKEGMKVDTSRVRVDGVYMMCDTILDINKVRHPRYTFYRFFPNGKYYCGTEYYCFPDSAELNALDHGTYGLYRVENDSTLKTELHSPYAGFVYAWFRIDGGLIESMYTQRVDSDRKETELPVSFRFYKCSLSSVSYW